MVSPPAGSSVGAAAVHRDIPSAYPQVPHTWARTWCSGWAHTPSILSGAVGPRSQGQCMGARHAADAPAAIAAVVLRVGADDIVMAAVRQRMLRRSRGLYRMMVPDGRRDLGPDDDMGNVGRLGP